MVAHARERAPRGLRRRQAQEGSKVHIAFDTLGHLVALHVTPTDRQDRTQVRRTAKAVRHATGGNVELAYVDQGYTGEQAKDDADDNGISLHVAKRPQAKRGFVLLPGRWVVEWRFAWIARFRRLPKTVKGLPPAVVACIMTTRYFAERAEHALGL